MKNIFKKSNKNNFLKKTLTLLLVFALMNQVLHNSVQVVKADTGSTADISSSDTINQGDTGNSAELTSSSPSESAAPTESTSSSPSESASPSSSPTESVSPSPSPSESASPSPSPSESARPSPSPSESASPSPSPSESASPSPSPIPSPENVIQVDDALKAQIKIALLDSFNQLLKENPDFVSTDAVSPDDDSINIDLIFSNKLYDESTPEEFLKNIQNNSDYAGVIMERLSEAQGFAPQEPDSNTQQLVEIADDPIPFEASALLIQSLKGPMGPQQNMPSYFTEISKSARFGLDDEGKDKFRQYDESIKYVAGKSSTVYTTKPADIIMVMDNSSSMNGAKMTAAKLAADNFIDKMLSDNTGNVKIGIVKFSDYNENDSSNYIGLTDDKNNLKNYVSGFDATGNYTNIQGGIIKAKDILGIDDNSTDVSSERKKIIILLTDGMANDYSTDVDFCGMPPSSATSPVIGKMRWSYFKHLYSTTRSFPSMDGFNQTRDNVCAVLEAEFAVHQGVDLYTIAFGKNPDKDMLKNMTYDLNQTPRLTTRSSEFTNPLLNRWSPYVFSDRAYSSDESQTALDTVFGEISQQIGAEMKPVTITNTLSDDLEFANQDYTITDKPYGGGNPITTGQGTVSYSPDGRTITWTTAKDIAENTTYYLNYHTKTKATDDGYYYGSGYTDGVNGVATDIDGNVKKYDFGSQTNGGIVTSATCQATYDDNETYDIGSISVPVQPNLSISNITANSDKVLLYEKDKLNGGIINGNGDYTYQFSKLVNGVYNGLGTDEPYSGTLSNQGYTPINFKEVPITPDVSGDITYRVSVTDNFAIMDANGTKQTLTKDLTINCKLPTLTVNITGETAGVETRIYRHKGKKGIVGGYFQIAGEGKYTFDGEDFDGKCLKDVYFSAEGYVPYGYSFKAYNNRNTISYNNPNQVINITISRTDPYYYYDWAWSDGDKTLSLVED